MLDIVYQLSELENDIKWSSQKTIMFQTGIIKVCRKESATSTTSYAGGTSLEKRLEIFAGTFLRLPFEYSIRYSGSAI